MKEFFLWLVDLASNFRLHVLVLTIFTMLILLYFELILTAIVLLIPLLFSLFPLSTWFRTEIKYADKNIKHYDICSFNMEWNAENHNSALEYIKSSGVDIMILQEVPGDLTKEICRYKDIFPYQYGEGHSHVMVLSKYKLKLVEYLPWPGKFKQRAIHVLCEIDGLALNIIAIHLQVTRRWKELSIRNQQLSTLLDRVNKTEGALILVGDFNAATGSTVTRMIERNSSLLSRESLIKYKATWPSTMGCFGLQLDHIYANKKIILGELEHGPVQYSDHRPIISKFSFYDASASSS